MESVTKRLTRRVLSTGAALLLCKTRKHFDGLPRELHGEASAVDLSARLARIAGVSHFANSEVQGSWHEKRNAFYEATEKAGALAPWFPEWLRKIDALSKLGQPPRYGTACQQPGSS